MRGTIREARNGTWWFQFSVLDGGKRRHIKRRGFRIRRDAEDALAKDLAAWGAGDRRVSRSPSAMTVAEHLASWVTITTPGLKPTTAASYRSVVDAWIVPHLGGVKLKDLTAERLVAFYATLAERGGRNGKPLGERSVQLAAVVLRASLDHAVERGQLAVNPATQVPRASRPKPPRRKEMKVWNAAEAAAFLDATTDSRWHPVWALALDSGARRGELAGLRWTDVDLDAATMTIRRNRVVVDGKGIHEGSPKTGRGRLVHLMPSTIAALRRWKAQQTAERLAWGPAAAGDYMYVVTLPDGTPPNPDRLTYEFRRAVRDVGVPRIRFHDVRHTSATLDLLAGTHPKVVAEKLGHSSISMTLDTYSAYLPSMGADAATRREALLYGTT